MGDLQVSLFGKFRVGCEGQDLAGFEQAKVQELFCYLLLRRGRPLAREILASLLWGDYPTQQARRYLSKSLWQLQTSLARAHSACQNLLQADLEWLLLTPQAGMCLDVADFEQAYAQVRDLPGPNLTCEMYASLCQAVELYRGDLLEGWFQDWCLGERERLQHIYLVMLEKLMRYCAAHALYEAGQSYAYSILSIDRARERTHRDLIRLFYLAGDRTGALRQYHLCCAALQEELGVLPSQRTEDLYAQVRADRWDGVAFTPSPAGYRAGLPVGENQEALGQIASQLEYIRTSVSQVERQIQSLVSAK